MKYFTMCVALILISTTVLGSVFLAFASQYFKNDKYRLLYDNAERASKITTQLYERSENNVVDASILASYLQTMASSIDSDFFVTDPSGRTMYCTELAPCVHTENKIDASVISSIKESGKYVEMGKLQGVYEENYYTVGCPVSDGNGSNIAYIFASEHVLSSQQSFLTEMLKIFLISSVAMIVVAFIVVYYMTVQMVKPLREMAEVAQQFGKGDFSARLEIMSYDEMGQLAMSLNNMAQSLSTLENTRRSFTANVSHELKTPMTSISGFIDGILDGTIPEEKQRYYLQIVSDEVKRLSRLVRTMLNLSKIEAGEMQIKTEKINIVDIICQTVFSFEQQIEKKNLTINGLDHDKVMVEADRDLIHQVVYNLTENAVKFVNEGGYIDFSFKSESGRVYVSIKNSGDGLSKEEIPKIFDRFYKTDKSRGLDKNGVGLGLYIVRSIVNFHGGDIIVRSVEGEYSEFVFTLPMVNDKNKFKKS